MLQTKTSDNKNENYSLNLNSGELKKINADSLKYGSSSSFYNLPPKATYSYLSGIASTYKLSYIPDSEMNIYNFLTMFKGGGIKPDLQK